MTKKQLIKKLAEKAGVHQWKIQSILDALVESATSELKQDRHFVITKLVTFSTGTRKARSFYLSKYFGGRLKHFSSQPAKKYVRVSVSASVYRQLGGLGNALG